MSDSTSSRDLLLIEADLLRRSGFDLVFPDMASSDPKHGRKRAGEAPLSGGERDRRWLGSKGADADTRLWGPDWVKAWSSDPWLLLLSSSELELLLLLLLMLLLGLLLDTSSSGQRPCSCTLVHL